MTDETRKALESLLHEGALTQDEFARLSGRALREEAEQDTVESRLHAMLLDGAITEEEYLQLTERALREALPPVPEVPFAVREETVVTLRRLAIGMLAACAVSFFIFALVESLRQEGDMILPFPVALPLFLLAAAFLFAPPAALSAAGLLFANMAKEPRKYVKYTRISAAATAAAGVWCAVLLFRAIAGI